MLSNLITKDEYVGSGAILDFLITFVFQDNEQIEVKVDGVLQAVVTDYTVSNTPNKITFVVAPILGAEIVISRVTALKQLIDYVQGAPFASEAHENQMDRMVMMAQEAAREITELQTILPSPLVANALIVVDALGENLINGPDATTITALQAALDAVNLAVAAASLSATNAATSATNAATSATNSATSETNAEASELAAIVAAQSAEDAALTANLDPVYLTVLDSPYNITAADSGNFFVVDATGGPFTFNLPLLSSLDLSGVNPVFMGKKSDSSLNPIIINSVGTDEIDQNGQTIQANVQNNGYRFVPDTDATPDSWTTIAIASATGATDALVPTGSVSNFAGSVAPAHWAICDGSAISRTVYSDLYAIVADTYGPGDGSTTFNLPDLRGEFMRGLDNGRGVDTGRVAGAAQADATAANGLVMGSAGAASGGIELTDNDTTSMRVRVRAATGAFSPYNVTSSKVNSNGIPGSVTNPGGITLNIPNHVHVINSNDNETRPRNMAMNYIIKL